MDTESPHDGPTRFLDPIDRTSEILFALIMVLTFTGTLSVVEADRVEVRTMLIGAIGCNIAWGLVDAVMYLMTSLTQRGRGIATLVRVRGAEDSDRAHDIIRSTMPQIIAAHLRPELIEAIRLQANELPIPARPRLRKQDWLSAIAVFFWVFATTFPVVIPFIFMQDAAWALRTSNAIAICLFFVTGFVLGRLGGFGPWKMGLAMVAVGLVLVAITIALGG